MQIELDHTVASLVEATDKLLWDSFRSAVNGTQSPSRLVFPRTSKGAVRVSEQEAKQLLIGQLNDSSFLFSVETPTLRNYGFSGKGERNAMTDITLYTEEKRCLNMEFKSGNTSTKRLQRKHINKDIQKLVFEDVDGFWFHILEKANGTGIETLWQTIQHELKAVTQLDRKFNPKLITFHCCVLREAYSVETTIVLNDDSRKKDWLDDLQPPVVNVKKGVLIDLPLTDGWIVRRSCSEVETVTMEAH
ncbi:MAG: hypothetical protein O3A29_20000 [Planctomycetota bacterium]|nr:hypothetical protein [Planctomycetota bacterium]